MSYKLIALDIDGTLLNSKHKMSECTTNVLKECLKRDIKVVLASGREYNSIEKYASVLGVKDYQITLNGAVIFDPIKKKTVRENILKKETFQDILDRFKDISHPYVVFDTLNYYYDKNYKNRIFAKRMSKITGAKTISVDRYEDIKAPTKVMTYILKKDLVEEVQASLIKENIKVMRTAEKAIEITNTDVNKGNALEYICKEYGFKREEVIAFGDSENDIEMIKYAGLGVAMGNAFDHVKDISDYVTKSNDEDGAVEVIKKFVFKSK